MPAIKLYDELRAPNRDEILRYAGAKEATAEVEELLDACLTLCEGQIAGRVCYDEFPVACEGSALDLGFAQTQSASLARHVEGCESIVVMAATVGLGIDRLIAKYSRLSPARALMFQAIGAERIEALCDAFCADLEQSAHLRGQRTTTRFSPGYGDLPLELQTDIFATLKCEKHIGLTLNSSLLMSPSKSVTAIIGSGNVAKATRRKATCAQGENAQGEGTQEAYTFADTKAQRPCGVCANCGKTDCLFRAVAQH